MPNFEIKKSESGADFSLIVGRPGIPGSHRVDGLTRDQSEKLGEALHTLCSRIRYETQDKIKSAIGIR
ncbi:MAG: hypothetical protein AAFR98_11955 [Pseudomonadota bacterium]